MLWMKIKVKGQGARTNVKTLIIYGNNLHLEIKNGSAVNSK